jgi:hypothetical protein
LRWFWWRINAFSEITAMAVSFLVAVFFQLVYPHLGGPALLQWQKLIVGIAVTTVAWVGVTLLTKPAEDETLFRFCRQIRAGGPGWREVERRAAARGVPVAGDGARWEVPAGLLCMSLACLAVFSTMFAIGACFYGRPVRAAILAVVAAASTAALFKLLPGLYAKEG